MSRPVVRAAGCGIAASAVGLTATELAGALLAPSRPSLVSSVASRVVVALAGPLRDPAVRLFGTNDKAALVTGIVVVTLAVGATVGVLARHLPPVGPLAFAGFAAAGAWAAWRDPNAAPATSTLAAATGALVGSISLRALLGRESRRDEREAFHDGRRDVVVAFAAMAAMALAGTQGARWLRERSRPIRRAGDLPAPRRTAEVPPQQPFPLDGLDPYITAATDFYRIDTAVFVPSIDPATWRLSIDGMVEHPRTYSYEQLLTMPMVEEVVTLACVSNDVGGHLVGNARWLGVPLRDLLAHAGVHPAATQIVGRAADDFSVNVATADALDGRVALVAVGMNGAPLPAKHGYPARLVVAGFYGYASATKWLTSIELTRREDHDSFWVERGWAKDGPIRLQSRFDTPRPGARLAADAVHLGGMAWGPAGGVGLVEVSIEGGPWRTARLGFVSTGDTWVQWSYEWADPTPGDHVAAVRATDVHGAVQTDRPSPPEPSGATGLHYRSFSVA